MEAKSSLLLWDGMFFPYGCLWVVAHLPYEKQKRVQKYLKKVLYIEKAANIGLRLFH